MVAKKVGGIGGRILHEQVRAAGSREVSSVIWRFKIATTRPRSLKPNHVPPARRSRPLMILGVVCNRLGGADGRS
jgi:hypothetical protein